MSIMNLIQKVKNFYSYFRKLSRIVHNCTPCSYGEGSAFVRLECPPLITVYQLACGEEESSWAQANNDEVEQWELGLTHLYTGK